MSEVFFNKYFHSIIHKYKGGTEHTLRTDFEILLNEIKNDKFIKIIQESTKEEFSEKPDFKITKNGLIIGYIETKKIEAVLEKIIDPNEESRDAVQFRRYLKISNNLILTNYKQFMLFKNGNNIPFRNIQLFNVTDRTLDKDDVTDVMELFNLFFIVETEFIDKPEKLASLLADRTRLFKEFLYDEIEKDEYREFKERLKGENGLYDLLKTNLIEDLDEDEFYDAYVQTITYGLFLASLNSEISQGIILTEKNVLDYIPDSIGLIKELFETIKLKSIPISIHWIIEEILNVLNKCKIEQLIINLSYENDIDFKDPYVYFYENFLEQYDKEKKKKLGVFYTPKPVVHFIINNIDKILNEKFGTQGLKDSHVTVLDFATGTGTFIIESYKKCIETSDKGLRNNLISDHLLKNFYGFEYLIAPYVIAHMKIITYLKEVDYDVKNNERLQVYLADTLDDKRYEIWKLFPKISEESEESLKIKLKKDILVVMGNPPYNVKSKNKKPFTEQLLIPYKKDLKEKKVNWDDYEKFISYANWKINNTGSGIVGIITNNSFIDAVVKRIMRKQIFNDFDIIYILNLHGHKDKKEPDENIFDIRTGVCISFFIKLKEDVPLIDKKIYYFSSLKNNILTKKDKFEFLQNNNIDTINWVSLNVTSPNFYFIQKDITDKEEYDEGWSINDIFKIHGSGVKTDRDELFIDHNKDVLEQRMKTLFSHKLDKIFIDKYNVNDSSSYNLLKRVESEKFDASNLYPFHYRPFNNKWIYYKQGITSRPAYEIMKHFLNMKNKGIITTRQFVEDVIFNHIFITDKLTDIRITTSNRGTCYIYPLYLVDDKKEKQQIKLFKIATDPYKKNDLQPNFSDDFKTYISKKYSEIPSPEIIFGYIYAMLYSINYRIKYNEFLHEDFPKIPFIDNYDAFKQISQIGNKLIDNHLIKMTYNTSKIGYFPIAGDNLIDKNYLMYDEKLNRIIINEKQYFENTPVDVWEFNIGGYQVVKKWLEENINNNLSYSDIEYFKNILNSISETIKLMIEIDDILDKT